MPQARRPNSVLQRLSGRLKIQKHSIASAIGEAVLTGGTAAVDVAADAFEYAGEKATPVVREGIKCAIGGLAALYAALETEEERQVTAERTTDDEERPDGGGEQTEGKAGQARRGQGRKGKAS